MKKGFTLVELIAVIAIIAVISLAMGINYYKIKNDHNKDACRDLKKQLENSAIEYVQDKNLFHNDNSRDITYKDLYEKGYMDSGLKNPFSETDIADDTKIRVSINQDGNYSTEWVSSFDCE